MIDPHVHLRDGKQKEKETVAHGLAVAYQAGLDGVFEMPNTDPPLLTRQTVEERLQLADQVIARSGYPIFHGLYIGLTGQPAQIRAACQLHQELFPRVVGLKLYAGSSTGDLAVTETDPQALIFRTLTAWGYAGVLAVHAEAENLIQPSLFRPEAPHTHSLARPVQAEVASVRQLIRLAQTSGFRGTLHICHVSSPQTVQLIAQHHGSTSYRLTCGVTPHHLLLNEMWQQSPFTPEQGLWLKVNPPLRPATEQTGLVQSLLTGAIDWIETDHAPHTLTDKYERYASGLPGFPIYPYFINWLKNQPGMSDTLLDALTHENIVQTFGLSLANTKRVGLFNLAGEYAYDPYQNWYKEELK
jgi:dihydroorotase